MIRFFLTVIIFAFLSNVSAQLEINSSGQVGIGTASPQYKLHVVGDTYATGNMYLGNTSNFLGTTSNVPLTLKVNNILSGFTGSSSNTNMSFGYEALLSRSGGIGNTAVGVGTLRSAISPNYNTAIGYCALYKNTGNYNVATGSGALYSNITGTNNIATGHQALYSNTTGSSNIANGTNALYSNTTGGNNIANGTNALYFNMEGTCNIASGSGALYSNTKSSCNIAIGFEALYSTTGSGNTANGHRALNNNFTGYNNVATGIYALSNNTTGYNNTAIGSYADVNANNLYNATAIGYYAIATTNNQVKIGNTSVTSIVGGNNITIISDGRTKKNIRTDVPGLAFINHLQPVTYNLDLDVIDELQKSDNPRINARIDSLRMARSPEEKESETKARVNKEKIVYSGFIAQDVEKAANSVGYNFSGVDAPENGKGTYGLRYAEFVVPLVKAVQELSEKNDQLQKQVDELTKLVNSLLNKKSE